jgi:outer membrane translocation and assembly module TamA
VAVTGHDFADFDDQHGFRRVDYDAIQHVPLGRDTWVLALRGRVETTFVGDGDAIPFFMLPALGGGSSLRGFASWRFRDRHSLLLSAEWRVLVNRFLDTAVFYDAGKVTSRMSDLDFDGLKNDYGFGFRFHGPIATPLRIELAKSNEGLVLVFSAHAPF